MNQKELKRYKLSVASFICAIKPSNVIQSDSATKSELLVSSAINTMPKSWSKKQPNIYQFHNSVIYVTEAIHIYNKHDGREDVAFFHISLHVPNMLPIWKPNGPTYVTVAYRIPSFITTYCNLGPVSISDKTSLREISWNLEAIRLAVKIIESPWSLTGTSATQLSRGLPNCKAIG